MSAGWTRETNLQQTRAGNSDHQRTFCTDFERRLTELFIGLSKARSSTGRSMRLRRSVVRSANVPWERGGTSFEDYTAKDKPSGNAS